MTLCPATEHLLCLSDTIKRTKNCYSLVFTVTPFDLKLTVSGLTALELLKTEVFYLFVCWLVGTVSHPGSPRHPGQTGWTLSKTVTLVDLLIYWKTTDNVVLFRLWAKLDAFTLSLFFSAENLRSPSSEPACPSGAALVLKTGISGSSLCSHKDKPRQTGLTDSFCPSGLTTLL